MDEERFPTVWCLTCPCCGEVITFDMFPGGGEAPGIGRCSAGHDLLTFDRDTLGTLAVGRVP